MYLRFLILLSILAVQPVFAQEHRCYIYEDRDTPRERFFDFITTDIFLDIDTDSAQVDGEVLHTFSPLRNGMDTVWLDGPNVKVVKAFINEQPIEWESHKEGTTFKYQTAFLQDSTYSLRVQYEAKPKRGMYFIGWDDKTDRRRKQIWTQGQGIDNRHWFPHFDDMSEKVFISTTVVFDTNYKVLSNGNLDTLINNGDGTQTWYYKMKRPHASYLTMLAIGDYDIDTLVSNAGTPIHLWYYPEWKYRNEATYYRTKDMVDYFEKWFDIDYPWGSYSQVPVEDFLYGAMENTSATIFGDFFNVDEREFIEKNYVYVNAHEFVHQWLGDLVTSRSSGSHWIHESMATYFHTRWYGEVFGKEEFDLLMRSYNVAALKASKRNNYAISHGNGGTPRFYFKGAFVMEMLRNYVGEDHFKQALNYFVQKHAYQNVDGNDLLNAFHESTGYSLRWFWDQWIYRGGEPKLQVEFIESDNEYTWEIRQDLNSYHSVVFKLPFDLELNFEDGQTLKKSVFMEDSILTVSVPKDDRKLKFPLFDPGSKLLKDIEYERDIRYVKAQAEFATEMIDRLDAIKKLKSLQVEKKRKLFLRIFKKAGEHYAVKEEIINQLSGDSKSSVLLDLGLKDEHHKVRLTALTHYNPDSKKKIAALESLLEDRSYSVVELALVKLLYSSSEKKVDYFETTKDVWGNSSANVRITWLAFNIQLTASEVERKQYIEELIDLTSSSYNFMVRSNAVGVVKELDLFDAVLAEHLINGLTGFNHKLRKSYRDVMVHFAKNENYREIIIDVASVQDLTKKQYEYLFKIIYPKTKKE